MADIYIIYKQYLDFEGKQKRIGGVETYIANLAKVFSEALYSVHIYQQASEAFELKENGIVIHGIVCNKFGTILKEAEKHANLLEDILIFAADYNIQKTKFKKVLAIQHGIGWDVPSICNVSQKDNLKFLVLNSMRAWKKYMQYKQCESIVCVDYNFLNWYRTQIAESNQKMHVIPNFTKIPSREDKAEKREVSIIFARRFCDYRGTRIFTEAIIRVLEKHPNVQVTIAGEGPDEAWMKEKLNGYSTVCFTRFLPEESVTIHQNYDIAVVPSLGSEGTSLSLLEAMAATCAVVCTNIGGLTNIVIDGFNGVIVQPNIEELACAIEGLCLDRQKRKWLSENGYKTVKSAFSIERWQEKWLEVISSLENKVGQV